jgi:flagellar hook assembly protein FlgD
LFPPYPNPFNSSLVIPFELLPGFAGEISLKIYNVLGQEVNDLTNEVIRILSSQHTGNYQITWEGKDQWNREVGNGVYLIEIKSGSITDTEKVVLLK